LDRATEPTLGSTTTSVSGESASRSCSATTPSFMWSRTAIRASRDLANPRAPQGSQGLTDEEIAALAKYVRHFDKALDKGAKKKTS